MNGRQSVKKIILLTATLNSFLTPFMGSSVNVALPSIAAEMNMDAVSMSMITTLYLLATAVCMVPAGKFADLHGRKKVFQAGSFIYLLASLVCSMASSPFMLFAGRILQGIGSAMVMSTGMAIISSVFPQGERGRALGINSASVYAGLTLGPFLGGWLTQTTGWRSIFLIHLPVGLTILVLLFLFLKNEEWNEQEKSHKTDISGTLLYGLFLIFIMSGFSTLPQWKGYVMITAGIIFFFLFFSNELHHPSPIIDMSLFRENKVFTFSSLAALINYSATHAIVFLLSLYLQYIKQFSPRQTGMIILTQPLMMAIISPFAGALADRINANKLSSAGMAVSAAGLFLFTFFNDQTSTGLIISNLILVGIGFGLFISPNTAAVMASVGKKHYGVASSLLGTMRLLGQMFSLGIAMMIIAVFLGKVKIQPSGHAALLKSMHVSFIVFALLSVAGIFAALIRNRHAGNNDAAGTSATP